MAARERTYRDDFNDALYDAERAIADFAGFGDILTYADKRPGELGYKNPHRGSHDAVRHMLLGGRLQQRYGNLTGLILSGHEYGSNVLQGQDSASREQDILNNDFGQGLGRTTKTAEELESAVAAAMKRGRGAVLPEDPAYPFAVKEGNENLPRDIQRWYHQLQESNLRRKSVATPLPQINRRFTAKELRQYGLVAPGEWYGQGGEYMHSIPTAMDPARVAMTQKEYQYKQGQKENPTDAPPEPVRPGDLRSLSPEDRMRILEGIRGKDWPGPKPPPKPRKKSFLDVFEPYAKTSTDILKSDTLHSAIEGMATGTGPAGMAGIVFSPKIPLATQIGAQGVKRGTAYLDGLTENPNTWWVPEARPSFKKGSNEDQLWNIADELSRKHGIEILNLHRHLRGAEGGPTPERGVRMQLDKYAKTAKLDFIGVKPEDRGNKWGGEILESALKVAKGRGMTSVELNALPGPVLDAQGGAVVNKTTGKPYQLTEWYADHGFVEQPNQPHEDGMTPMSLDLTKWPPKSKANQAIEAHVANVKRMIEGGLTTPQDRPPTKTTREMLGPQHQGVNETGYTGPPNPERSPYEINLRALIRMDAPEDIWQSYRPGYEARGNRLPEAWSSPSDTAHDRIANAVSPREALWENARDWHRDPRNIVGSIPHTELQADPDWANLTSAQRLALRNRRIEGR